LVGEARDDPSLFSAIMVLALTAKRNHINTIPNEVHVLQDFESFARMHFWGGTFFFFSERDVQKLLNSVFYAFPFLGSFVALPI